MTNSIMKADYYLLGPDNTTESLVPYYQLLQKFPHSPILTFNYDGMVELLFHKERKWNLTDGFGVKVDYEQARRSDRTKTNKKSERKILHLHGSLYVYSVEFQFSLPDNDGTQWMSEKDPPKFYIVRYVDDFVCAFQYKHEAESFLGEIKERLKKFGLEIAEDKTKLISFSRFRQEEKTSFDLLGFEFRWGKDRKGLNRLMRRTSRKKLKLTTNVLQICNRYCIYSICQVFLSCR